MKFTFNIDDALLTRVMETTGAKTKTEAINAALAEMDRRAKLVALLKEDTGITPKEWGEAWEEPVFANADEDTLSARVAEEAPARERKPRSRR
jgi:Arc/MetJ family transcription regulator